ncbi:MAG: hypothetical protein DBY32_03970 [Phascolarctobacterium sp.]|nr:MAG: hypothetical protein DBY32_03970 [Phascolarctobacterium sp.]
MKFKIINCLHRNEFTGGVMGHIQTEDGKNWFADLSDVDNRPELMIFKANNKGRVNDWREVYCAYPREISADALLSGVQRWADAYGAKKVQ